MQNELNLPSIEFLVQSDGTRRALGMAIEKILYPGRLSVVVEQTRTEKNSENGSFSGWDNLEVGLKWQAFNSDWFLDEIIPGFERTPFGKRQRHNNHD